MKKETFVKIYRLLFGLLALSAIITEIVVLLSRGTFVPTNFFSYFTIESNLLAAGLFLGLATADRRMADRSWVQFVRGAITLYMIMTGIIFASLLAGLEDITLTAAPWDNVVLHYIMPTVVLIDFIADPPKTKVPFKRALFWLALPIGYIAYTLLRGAMTGWYPYPFLNAGARGYGSVFIIVAVLSIGVVVGSWLIASIHRMQKPR